jgi:hypothetical protein
MDETPLSGNAYLNKASKFFPTHNFACVICVPSPYEVHFIQVCAPWIPAFAGMTTHNGYLIFSK